MINLRNKIKKSIKQNLDAAALESETWKDKNNKIKKNLDAAALASICMYGVSHLERLKFPFHDKSGNV